MSRKSRWFAGAVVVAALAAGGCGSARYVMVEERGGAVAIPTNISLHRTRAMKLMAAHCAAGYRVTREEEAVVGQVVRGETVMEPDSFSRQKIVTTKDYVVGSRTEWRIHFSCLDGK